MDKRRRFLENARECFRQAAEAANAANMKLLVELGLEYLRMADEDDAAGVPQSREARMRIH
jgi:hypothetical protein